VTENPPPPRPEVPAARGERVLPELPFRNESEILQSARWLVREGGGEARIQLVPPQLGELRMHLTLHDGNLQLSLLAERLPVADLLARHLPELRQALQALGLDLARVDVEVRGEDGSADPRPRDDAPGREGASAWDRAHPAPEESAWSGPPQGAGPSPIVSALGTVDVHV
jgi:hypothetical protein